MTPAAAPVLDLGHRPMLPTFCYACGHGASPLWPEGCSARGRCFGTGQPLALVDALFVDDPAALASAVRLHGTAAQLRTVAEYFAAIALDCLTDASFREDEETGRG